MPMLLMMPFALLRADADTMLMMPMPRFIYYAFFSCFLRLMPLLFDILFFIAVIFMLIFIISLAFHYWYCWLLLIIIFLLFTIDDIDISIIILMILIFFADYWCFSLFHYFRYFFFSFFYCRIHYVIFAFAFIVTLSLRHFRFITIIAIATLRYFRFRRHISHWLLIFNIIYYVNISSFIDYFFFIIFDTNID